MDRLTRQHSVQPLGRFVGLGTVGILATAMHPAWAHEHRAPIATTLEDELTQIAQTAVVEVTGIRLNQTENGLEVILDTRGGEVLQSPGSVTGNAVIVDIPNAVLALPEGEPFEQFGPAAGIALLSVMNMPEGGIRVSITGTDAPPQVQASTATGNWVLSVVPGVAAATEAEAEAIQVVVSATRTEEDLQDLPRSVTVVTREDIEQQAALSTDFRDILGNLVPGFGPPTSVSTPPVDYSKPAGTRDHHSV